MLFTLLLNFALAFQPTPEAACSAKDFRSALGRVRDQGDLDWCYAYAAADLLQFALQSKEQVSATHLALLYNQKWEDSPIAAGGKVHKTLNEALSRKTYLSGLFADADRGYCNQERDDYMFRSDNKTSLKQKLRKFRDLKTAYDRANHTEFEKISTEIVKPENIKTEFMDVIKFSNSHRVFLQYANYMCGANKKYIPDEKRLEAIELEGKGDALLKRLHSLLSENQMASIAFNATFLRRSVGGLNDFMFRHASVVAGRRWNTESKSCEILVRDSRGATCEKYVKEHVTCDPKDPGNLWIREELLQQTILGLTFLVNTSR